MDIILASGSPRRRELLTQMGLSFRVVVSDADETVDKSLSPAEQVSLISRRKAGAVAKVVGPDALVVAADTIVALEGQVMGKPHIRAEAVEMLSRLSGRTHEVYTGFTLQLGERVVTQAERTAVTFRDLTQSEIEAYVDTGEPMDKAGAYGIQGLGSLLVSGIRGDYFNVMGLPVCRLGQALKEFGLDPLVKG